MSGRTHQLTEGDGDGAVWGGIGFAASLVVGVALSPFRTQMGLKNVVIVYPVAAAGERAGPLDRRRVGTLVVLPAADRPLLRTTRTAIAAVAHALALTDGSG